MKAKKLLIVSIAMLLAACTDNCVQEHYWQAFKGIVTGKYLSRYKDIPVIEVRDSSGKRHSLRFYLRRDTLKNEFWQSVALADTIVKEEGLAYKVIHGDTTLTLTWNCKEE